jgi:penicillin-binding protein 2
MVWRTQPIFASIAFLAIVSLLAPTDGAARTRRRRPARRSAPQARRFPDLILPGNASDHDRLVAQACLRALGGHRGSVMAMDPRTGRVLALVNPEIGLFNAFTPCSVFKIVVAIGGLSEGIITPETIYNCHGGCWTWPGHGPINLRRALAVSCEQLGYARIQYYAQQLGLGTLSGINLTGETPGHLPASVLPQRVGRLSSHATGISTSVVQIGILLSAAINGGVIYQPQIAGPTGFVPRERWRLPKGTRLDGLADGFMAAVNEGSATGAFDPDVVVAGKTGSCRSLGWFASYLVSNRPELVIVVFVRPGNGHLASRIAGQIYMDIYKLPPLPRATLAPPGGRALESMSSGSGGARGVGTTH